MNKRILFVDDDPFLRQVYTMVLDDQRDGWEVTTAAGGKQALELMEHSAFDVIVSDMRMPGMSGAELIGEVKRRFPRTSRIILSGTTDQEEIAQCLGETHQFLAKPVDAKALKSTLARICGLDAYLRDEKLKALVAQIGALPSFPSLYTEIMKQLGAGDPSIESIAGIVAKDPGMMAKLLQIVNSAVFGLARKVSRPFDAVQYLGMGTVRSLVLTAHIFSRLEGPNLKGLSITRLWDHAMRCGVLSRRIMHIEHAELSDAEDAYVAGMLHDIGKLMLANSLSEDFQRGLAWAAERGVHPCETETEIFGATHAGVGAYLLGLWGLPASIVEAVAFHHAPAASDLRAFGPLVAVHVANVLEQELFGDESHGRPAELDLEYLSSIGVADRLDSWRGDAETLLRT